MYIAASSDGRVSIVRIISDMVEQYDGKSQLQNLTMGAEFDIYILNYLLVTKFFVSFLISLV